MRKLTFIIIAALILLSYNPTAIAQPEQQVSLPSISGEACILMDATTGKILYEKNAYKQFEPASTTKIMTAILALENGNLSDIVVTSSTPPRAEGTRIYLEEGERLTLEQMLYGMMLNSGNDAAVAIAEHIGGSVDEFVDMMNKKASEIGAKNTHFANPSGLSEKGHLTTAYDLALISRYALEHIPKFREIVSTKTKEIPWEGQEWDRQLINLNKLLFNYEGADGVKTGYTSTAGFTLVASATRNGWQLICVILKSSPDIYKDAMKVLDYGFDNFEIRHAVEKNTSVGIQKVLYGDPVELLTKDDFTIVVEKGSPEITHKIDISSKIKAPISENQVVGQMLFYQDGKEIGKIDIIAADDVSRKIYTFWWFWPLAILAVLYVPFRINVAIRRYRRHKRRIRYISYINKKYR